jgi:hypothetical protein
MEEDPLKKARHDLRGHFNALKLSVSAFAFLDSKKEELEFLEMIVQATDRTVTALEAYEALLDRQASARR